MRKPKAHWEWENKTAPHGMYVLEVRIDGLSREFWFKSIRKLYVYAATWEVSPGWKAGYKSGYRVEGRSGQRYYTQIPLL